MTKSLREEIEAAMDQYLHERPHHSAAESHVAMKGYRAGATAFAIRALEMAADIAHEYASKSGHVNTHIDSGRIAALIRKLADELRGSK